MLRSVFTLFQNFLDVTTSDIDFIKEKRRRSSTTVVKYNNRPDYLTRMDLELRGIAAEDTKTADVKSIEKKKAAQAIGERKSFDNEEEYEQEVSDASSNTLVARKPRVNVHDLLEKTPKLQQSLTGRNRVLLDKGNDQLTVLLEQVNKMKVGLQRLHEIAQKFNGSESFKENVDYLVKHLKPALEKAERSAGNLEPKK